jgi:hypothetical protein
MILTPWQFGWEKKPPHTYPGFVLYIVMPDIQTLSKLCQPVLYTRWMEPPRARPHIVLPTIIKRIKSLISHLLWNTAKPPKKVLGGFYCPHGRGLQGFYTPDAGISNIVFHSVLFFIKRKMSCFWESVFLAKKRKKVIFGFLIAGF